jgi:transcriptional regulator of heat shock response
MEKYAILLGYFNKQLGFVERLYEELISVDLSIYEKRFLFAMRVQQFYTAIEDLLKQIAKSFENHIDQMSSFHKELLARMNTEVPQIRSAVISHQSFLFLDKLRAFRHFVRHAYDCELDEKELLLIQNKLRNEFQSVKADLEKFKSFIRNLSHT